MGTSLLSDARWPLSLSGLFEKPPTPPPSTPRVGGLGEAGEMQLHSKQGDFGKRN